MAIAKELWCRVYHRPWFWIPAPEMSEAWYFCDKCKKFRKGK